jgi:hypothetical protein
LHAWVIVDLLFPIARDCSESTYLRFVEIKDKIIILLTHALWLSKFVLHAWVMMDWV